MTFTCGVECTHFATITGRSDKASPLLSTSRQRHSDSTPPQLQLNSSTSPLFQLSSQTSNHCDNYHLFAYKANKSTQINLQALENPQEGTATMSSPRRRIETDVSERKQYGICEWKRLTFRSLFAGHEVCSLLSTMDKDLC